MTRENLVSDESYDEKKYPNFEGQCELVKLSHREATLLASYSSEIDRVSTTYHIQIICHQ